MISKFIGLTLLLVAAQVSSTAQQPSPGGIAIAYSLPARGLVLHEPVVITFSARNDTDASVILDLGQDRKGGFQFWVTPPGREPVKLRRYSHNGISRLGTLRIEPRQAFSEELILNEWYDFPSPGRYELAGRLVPPITGDGSAFEKKDTGFRGVILVGPEDATRLSEVCRSLAKQVSSSETYEQAAEAALALSYVKDPVAVPYLRQILFVDMPIQPIAIQGLERIGDDEAVRALGSALRDNLPDDTGVLARAALEEIESETTDVARKETIKAILATGQSHQ